MCPFEPLEQNNIGYCLLTSKIAHLSDYVSIQWNDVIWEIVEDIQD